MGGIGAVVSAHHQCQVSLCFQQFIGAVLVVVCGVAQRIAGVGKVLFDIAGTVLFDHHLSEEVRNALCFAGQHGGLVHYPHALQIFLRIKARGKSPGKFLKKFMCGAGSAYIRSQARGFFQVAHDY